MALKVHAGDFPKRTGLSVAFGNAALTFPWEAGDGWGLGKSLRLDKQSVRTLAIASDEDVKRFSRTLGAAAVGGVLLGPAGALAGALIAGSKKNLTFVLELEDGRRMLASVDTKTFNKLQAILF